MGMVERRFNMGSQFQNETDHSISVPFQGARHFRFPLTLILTLIPVPLSLAFRKVTGTTNDLTRFPIGVRIPSLIHEKGGCVILSY